jgi:hypothetical protein
VIVTALGRPTARAVAASLMLLVATVMPAMAGAGPTDLVAPSVSPTTGTTATLISFAVTFRSAKGTQPDYVHVVVGSTPYTMKRTAGAETWKQGVRYTLGRRLPVGTWTVRFEASTQEHFTVSIDGATVRISKAPPKPVPAPKPAPQSAPKPTTSSTHASAPTPRPRPTSLRATSPALALTTGPGAYRQPVDSVGDDASSPDRSGTGGAPWAAGVLPGGPTNGRGGGDGGSNGLRGGLGGPASILAILAQVAPTAVVTTGGVTMVMAFMVFGKRRRDGEPTGPDDVLAANAALGSGYVPTSGMMPSSVMPSVMPNAVSAASAVQAAVGAVPAPVDMEASLPRWRRPSLMEARKTDPLRSVSTSVRLTFEGDVGNAVTGMERRLIRYRLVSLLSAPDEVRGVEIGVLDEGDEVVLMEKRGTYWRVLCPDGREGWLHKMTLGDVVIDSSTAASETWTAGDDGPALGGFEDVLRAYTERRQQFGES